MELSKIKAIVFDIDGTLTEKDNLPSKELLFQIHKLHASGVKIALATGRNYSFSKEIIDLFNFEHLIGINNGSAIIHLPHEKVIESTKLLKKDIECVRIFLLENGYPAIVNTLLEDREITIKFKNNPSAPGTENFLENTKNPIQEIESLDEMPQDFFMNLYSSVPKEKSEIIYRELLKNFSNFNFTRISDPLIQNSSWIGLMPKESGKHKVLHKLKEIYNIPISNIMAAGDDLNDISMIQEAGIGVAMQKAPSAVKKAANICIQNDSYLNLTELLKNILNEKKN